MADTKLFLGNEYLRLIYKKEEIIIGACDGSGFLFGATNLFTSIDPDFRRDVSENKISTKAVKVKMYELVESIEFIDVFNSIGVDLNALCFTQHQIREFVNSHRDLLPINGSAAFILFKSDEGHFFSARIFIDSDNTLHVKRRQLDDGYIIWIVEKGHLIIIPQLEIAL